MRYVQILFYVLSASIKGTNSKLVAIVYADLNLSALKQKGKSQAAAASFSKQPRHFCCFAMSGSAKSGHRNSGSSD
jgi:hypothetical protein